MKTNEDKVDKRMKKKNLISYETKKINKKQQINEEYNEDKKQQNKEYNQVTLLCGLNKAKKKKKEKITQSSSRCCAMKVLRE